MCMLLNVYVYITSIVSFFVLYSTKEYYCITMVLYKSINIYKPVSHIMLATQTSAQCVYLQIGT